MRFDAPVLIGARTYGLKLVDVCYAVTQGSDIESVAAYDGYQGYTLVVEDATDRTSAFVDRFTLAPATPYVPRLGLALDLGYIADQAGAHLDVRSVKTTWTPVNEM